MPGKVYVTGVGMVTPVGLDTNASWNALLRGVSGIATITSFNPEGFETTFAGEVRGFSAEAYVDRKTTRRLDRFAQFAVAATRMAMAEAKLNLTNGSVDATRVASIIGSGIGGILTLSEQWGVLKEKGPSRVSPFLVPMMLADMGSGQVSIITGAKGPNYCTVSACSSGADAIGQAFESIRRGEVDIALTGGTEAPICPIAMAGFNACMALSKRNDDPKGASRPFDKDRDGFVMGEGAGIMVIESEESAVRRGVTPLVEMAGYGATSDAHHVTHPGPEGEGAARAMRRALAQAGMKPRDIDYVNAHGTGTPLNDKFETMAMKAVFGAEAYKVKVSSTKSMTGHLLGAAGGVEAVISVLAITRGACPPTINLVNPDPDCDLDYTPHLAHHGEVRSSMSNNLGFGGHNASLVFRRVAS